ncbi:hypothetical protein T484DRAFT_1962805 [Baffinella frigidus]|nr:hypothetical protein T484DRAFT_1962805 [Cryptophyta sp. CCMP2293]
MERSAQWMLLVAVINRLIYRVGAQMCNLSHAELRLLSLQFHAAEEASAAGESNEWTGAPPRAHPPISVDVDGMSGAGSFSWHGFQALLTPRGSQGPASARSFGGSRSLLSSPRGELRNSWAGNSATPPGTGAIFTRDPLAPSPNGSKSSPNGSKKEPHAWVGGRGSAGGKRVSGRFTPSLPFVLGVEG